MIDFDPLRTEGKVPSPCINVCRMHPTNGLCEGCLRTIPEIRQWSKASEDDKRAMWATILQRRSVATE